MNKQKNYIGLGLVLCIVYLVCVYNKEYFDNYNGYYKQHCSTCSTKSRDSCAKCTGCGYCISASGHGKCISGDDGGPTFTDKCEKWEYGDSYYYYPYSHIYPITKTRSYHPHSRWRRDHNRHKPIPIRRDAQQNIRR